MKNTDSRRSGVLRLSDLSRQRQNGAEEDRGKEAGKSSGCFGYTLLALFAIGLLLSSGLVPADWIKDAPPWILYGIVLPAILVVIAGNVWSFIDIFRKKKRDESSK